MPKRVPRLSKSLENSLRRILSVPTAPFHEHWLRDYLEKRFSKLRNVLTKVDTAGNLWVVYRPKGGGSPKVCLQAHLDHPGYVADPPNRDGSATATGYGGVPVHCVDSILRFFSSPQDGGTPARIRSFQRNESTTAVSIETRREIPPGSIGMWDFGAFQRRGRWFEGRSFDNTLGTAILAVALEEHVKRRAKSPLMFVFTRAEEVGCVGLVNGLRRPPFRMPRITLTIEMPRASGDLTAGGGVMLRSGDRDTNFDPEVLLHLEDAAAKVRSKNAWFRSQRRAGLLGYTEVTVFRLFDYQAGCLCLPVVNAHNINLDNQGRPAPEKIHENDLLSLLALLRHLLSDPWSLEETRHRLKTRILAKAKTLRPLL